MLTTSTNQMISNQKESQSSHRRTLPSLRVSRGQSSKRWSYLLLPALLCLGLLHGCAASLPIESPLCPERDFVLQPVSVEDQRVLHDASPLAFASLADNDLVLKGYAVRLERLIAAHDEPLGGCD